jgi:membrane fusion protein, multidrug efflux system
MAQVEQEKEKKGIKVYIPLFIVIVLVLIGGWWWYRDYSRYISTDDAYVDADKVSLGSKMLGRLAKLNLAEGDSVKKDLLVAEIDSTELIAQKNQTLALLDQAEANLSQASAKIKLDDNSIKVQKISLQRAKDDAVRAKSQFDGGVITKEQYEHIQKTYESAEAQLNTSLSQLDVSKAQLLTARAAVETSKAQIGSLQAQILNTRLYAPFDGIVSKRWLLAGDIVQPGQSVYTITNDRTHWVIIYIEETNLNDIFIGQDAVFSIDAFPGMKFSGKVFYIGENTASQFSLIPASNASGNFTKVTQRVPVKISIDKVSGKNGETEIPHLVSGMSVIMKLVKK